jgi:DNA-binding protein HU-beta
MAGILDVAAALAKEYSITQTSAKEMVISVMDTIIDFAKTERIQVGKHIFKPTVRKAREGRNPKTGEAVSIPEKHGVKYKYTGDKKKVAKVAPAPDKKKKKK